MTTTTRSSDQVELAIHDLGGTGTPLLFVHATGFHGRCYQQIANHLADFRTCHAPDLRGHGDSSIPENGRFAWAGMADDLCAVLDHLGIDTPIDFVGHSMGGATVLATELRRPGTIRRAWLYEPIVLPTAEERPSPLAESARRRRPSFDDYAAARERYGSRPPFDAIDPAVLDDYVRFGFRPDGDEVTLKCAPETEARTFEGVDPELFAQLPTIQAPVTIVGSGDGGHPAQLAPMIAEQIPHSQFVAWTDDTHFGPFTNPQRAADEIRRVLQ